MDISKIKIQKKSLKSTDFLLYYSKNSKLEPVFLLK